MGTKVHLEKAEAVRWLNKVEDAGAFAPLTVLERLIAGAPQCVKETNDFGYLCGLVDARRVFEPLPSFQGGNS